MPRIIEVPGRGNVEFPDGMSDADITAALKKIDAESGMVRRGLRTVTGAVAAGLEGLAAVGGTEQAAGFGRTGPTIQPGSGMPAAEALVPQTGGQALAELGTLAAGAMVPPLAAGTAAAHVIPPLVRLTGALLGGAFGALATGEPAGPAMAQAGLGTGVGEIGGAATPVVLRSIPGARGRINAGDTTAVGEVIGDIVPALRGAKTVPDLVKMAISEEGRDKIGKVYADAVTKAETLTGGTARQFHIPALQPQPMTLKEVVEELQELGYKGYSGTKSNPLNRTVSGREARRLRTEALTELEAEMRHYNPTGEAWAAFTEGRTQYAKGMAFLDLLRNNKAFRGGSNVVELNLNNLRSGYENAFAKFAERLTPDELEAVTQVIYRGATLGTRDIMAPGFGRMMDAPMQVFGRGAGGSPQLLGAPIRMGLPNVGSQYTGQAGPQQAGSMLQSGLDIFMQRLGGAMGPFGQ